MNNENHKCIICGCTGNSSCGHEPINKKENCTLNECLICPCCVERKNMTDTERIYWLESLWTTKGDLCMDGKSIYRIHKIFPCRSLTFREAIDSAVAVHFDGVENIPHPDLKKEEE